MYMMLRMGVDVADGGRWMAVCIQKRHTGMPQHNACIVLVHMVVAYIVWSEDVLVYRGRRVCMPCHESDVVW